MTSIGGVWQDSFITCTSSNVSLYWCKFETILLPSFIRYSPQFTKGGRFKFRGILSSQTVIEKHGVLMENFAIRFIGQCSEGDYMCGTRYLLVRF